MQRLISLTLCAVAIQLNSCAPRVATSVQKNQFPANYSPPDYSQLQNWASHPYKKDPSDSIPRPLQTESMQDTTVDVFFLHPTTLTSFKSMQWNADLSDSSINDKTDNTTILFQASVFNEYRVFAPRYRQAHLRSYYSSDTPSARAAFDLAYQDIRAAFMYYLKNFNQGRPIIIAGHSQGSTHGIRLVKEFFDDSLLKEQLVVAYLIGMQIPQGSFNHLSFCQDSIQTQCICGWRTFKAGYVPTFVEKEPDGSQVTNPLTWTTTGEYAPRHLNKGSVLREFNKIYKKVADAQVSGKILWIRQPQFPGSFLLRYKNYHIADINLFYVNLRENIRLRVNAFRNKPPL